MGRYFSESDINAIGSLCFYLWNTWEGRQCEKFPAQSQASCKLKARKSMIPQLLLDRNPPQIVCLFDPFDRGSADDGILKHRNDLPLRIFDKIGFHGQMHQTRSSPAHHGTPGTPNLNWS